MCVLCDYVYEHRRDVYVYVHRREDVTVKLEWVTLKSSEDHVAIKFRRICKSDERLLWGPSNILLTLSVYTFMIQELFFY